MTTTTATAPRSIRNGLRLVTIPVVALLLLAMAGPVWAVKPAGAGDGSGGGGGNQGTVKVVDPVAEVDDNSNDPHVCSFYLLFSEAPNGESGTWTVVDWPPTGDGTLVYAGTYDIPAGGTYSTGTMNPAAGHYQVSWQAVNDTTAKHKTLWVDAGCADETPPSEPPDEETPPSDEPSDPPADEPQDEPPSDEETPPSDEVTDPEQDVEDNQGQPPDEQPQDEQTDAEQGVEDNQDQPDGDQGEQPQEQPEEQPGSPDGDAAPSIEGPVVAELPDTAVPEPVMPGMGAALGILLLLVAHRWLRERGAAAR